MSLGERICRLRTERNMSQGDLANALEVSRQSVSKWETDGSIPELDKLVKMSGLFGVSLDELILGKKEEAAAEKLPEEQPVPKTQPVSSGQKTAGVILLCFAAFVLLFLTVLGGIVAGVLCAVPFAACGMICLRCRRNAGLWCCWVLVFAVNVYLRFATSITWRLIRWTLSGDPAVNYLRVIFAWIELVCFAVLLMVTVLRFRRQPLAATRRTVVLLFAGWILLAILHLPLSFDPLSGLAGICYVFSDWIKLILLTALLSTSLRLLCPKKQA